MANLSVPIYDAQRGLSPAPNVQPIPLETGQQQSRGFEQLGAGMEQLGQAAALIQARQDAVARADDLTKYELAGSDQWRAVQTGADISKPQTIRGFVGSLDALQQKIIADHAGSPASKARLGASLAQVRARLVDAAANAGVAAGHSVVVNSLDSQLKGITAATMSTPESLNAQYQRWSEALDDAGPALPEEDRIHLDSVGRSQIAVSAVEGMMAGGNFRGASQLLMEPGVIDAMQPEQQRSLVGRLQARAQAESDQRNAGQRKLEETAQILGVPVNALTPAQRMQIAGLSAGPQTPEDKLASIERALGHPLTSEQRAKALGVDTGAGGMQSTAGKMIEDRQKFVAQYGENSPQVEAFDHMATAGSSPPSLSDALGIRKEYTQISAPFVAVRDAYNRITASTQDPSPAGDMSVIFNFMKMLDPNSVVRESEYATAANATNVPDQIRNIYNRLLTGERLNPTQRDDFINQAQNLMSAQLRTQTALESQFKDIATRSGIDPKNAVIDFIGPLRPGGGGAGATGQPGVPGMPGQERPVIHYDLQGRRISGAAETNGESAQPSGGASVEGRAATAIDQSQQALKKASPASSQGEAATVQNPFGQGDGSIVQRVLGALESIGPTITGQPSLLSKMRELHAMQTADPQATMHDPKAKDLAMEIAGNFDFSGAIKAFHGSPNVLDKVGISKIGTGEGAQFAVKNQGHPHFVGWEKLTLPYEVSDRGNLSVPVRHIEEYKSVPFAERPPSAFSIENGQPIFRGGKTDYLFRYVMDYLRPFGDDVFVRSTRNKSDRAMLADGTHRGSVNHASKEAEGGLSVARDAEFPADYHYLVRGSVIGRGSDGEPLLDMKTAKPITGNLTWSQLQRRYRAALSERVAQLGITEEDVRALKSGARLVKDEP